jgi:hypothetical protein
MCLFKFSSIFIFLFMSIIINSHSLHLRRDDDDEYGDELGDVAETFNKIGKLYNANHTNFFTKIYEKADDKDITANVANLMKTDDQTSVKSFHKLNAIANNVLNADDKLKRNGQLKSTLKAMLNDPKMKMPFRVWKISYKVE